MIFLIIKYLMTQLKIIYKRIKQWIFKKGKLKYNLSFFEFINSFVFIIPLHSVLYLYFYYSEFGIHYFLYFNPIDFVYIFYSNNILLILYIIFISYCLLYFYFFRRSKFFKKKSNLTLSLLFISLITLLLILRLQTEFLNFYKCISICFILYLIALKSKQIRVIYFSIICFYLLFTIKTAKDNALIIKKNKPTFNIILNDNSFVLKQNSKKKNKNLFFIGKVTDYIFLYNDSIKTIRVIPIKEVKEINFQTVK